ncbi:c-type cytochrome [Pseudogulbenkiania subflava]|uniref:Cytochrome c556 n=1 Tax=Pseudogulbenkiania subflava DSM 22618 TaxID=1123014 RepID=A0A1Y6C5X2_9NEIS|nr:cytochrome c [Pseudogulbenkiania subflava]SMF45670.1 Cytochrome c556 [Pseudogulbenkiania subflava DSM 22618]
MTLPKNLAPALALLALSLPVLASSGEERQQSFKKILRTFEPMGLVARDRAPYRKDEFIKQADTLKQIAATPFTLFTPNSIDAKSRAKPEIWSQPEKFKAAQQKFLTAVNDLDAAAKTGDIANIKRSYGVVAQSCKSCHDSFRGPEK